MSLTTDIERALRSRADLERFRTILAEYRDQGMTQEEARMLLESMRFSFHGDLEDRLLEVLDLVTGFCAPDLRVWDDDLP